MDNSSDSEKKTLELLLANKDFGTAFEKILHTNEIPDNLGILSLTLLPQKVICLECGETMKMITELHLIKHGVKSREQYKEKWHIPQDMPLMSIELLEGRRNAMKIKKIWKHRKATQKTT